ncbi:MAG: membrane protein insertase YidC [Planctomycetota bacterium]|jgi:YidC/Oxa1 family membrane protein insertase
MDKKAIFAFILCAVIMLYFLQQFPQPTTPPEEEKQEEVVDVPVAKEKEYPEKEIRAEEQEKRTEEILQKEIGLQDNIVIQNDVIRTVWTNDGAALKSATLTKFKDSEKTQALELLKPTRKDSMPLSIELLDKKYQLNTRRYEVVERKQDKVVFAVTLENGIRVIKDISLENGKYHLDIAITFENTSNSNVTLAYTANSASGIYPEVDKITGLASVVGIDVGRGKTKLARTEFKDMPYENESVGIFWVGAVNKYFASILKPSTSTIIATTISKPSETLDPLYKDDFIVNLQTKRINITPQGKERHDYMFFLGPKKGSILKQYDGLSVLLEYGWTTSICKVLIKILNIFYGFIPNYGIAILLLTFMVKLILFPLTRKSQMSMFKMQQLQPLIGQLKAKYKGDKQRMGQEQMKLFKQHGVNPMSGCMPIMLQMPVFFALFRTLQLSFEMRQAPFVSWISDLSKPDTLLQLPFSLPFLGDGLNLLPIVMGIASFVQMKLTPKTVSGDDPQAKMQQKMMQMMPIIFPFILYTMPSGLTLYWTTSTLISIGEQMFIRRSIKKVDIYYKGKRITNGKGKGKTK